MMVDLFVPCCIDQFFPEKVDNIINIFNELDIEYSYNPEQTCCGQMSYKLGKWEEAEELAKKFVKMYGTNRNVVVPSPSCTNMVRQYYTKFFYNTSLHLELKSLQSRIFDINEFLFNIVKIRHWEGKFETKAYFLDSKSMLNNNGMNVDPCELLKMVKGLDLIAYSSDEECCGIGGSFAFQFPEISVKNGLKKLQEIVDSGAEYVITSEPSNILNLEGIANNNGINLKFATVSDILAISLQS